MEWLYLDDLDCDIMISNKIVFKTPSSDDAKKQIDETMEKIKDFKIFENISNLFEVMSLYNIYYDLDFDGKLLKIKDKDDIPASPYFIGGSSILSLTMLPQNIEAFTPVAIYGNIFKNNGKICFRTSREDVFDYVFSMIRKHLKIERGVRILQRKHFTISTIGEFSIIESIVSQPNLSGEDAYKIVFDIIVFIHTNEDDIQSLRELYQLDDIEERIFEYSVLALTECTTFEEYREMLVEDLESQVKYLEEEERL